MHRALVSSFQSLRWPMAFTKAVPNNFFTW